MAYKITNVTFKKNGRSIRLEERPCVATGHINFKSSILIMLILHLIFSYILSDSDDLFYHQILTHTPSPSLFLTLSPPLPHSRGGTKINPERRLPTETLGVEII